MKNTQKLAGTGLLIAIGTLLGSTFYIPFGVAKAFPMQHLINVLTAVLFGPAYAIMSAFCISLLRNLMGTGSLLAFPGSMIGALIAGLLYTRYQKYWTACIGECIGTGIIGSLIAYPIAKIGLGVDHGAFYFVIPFALSTGVGSLLAFVLLKALVKRVSFLNHSS